MGRKYVSLERVLVVLCGLLTLEAVFVAPLFSDAAFTLRQARAERDGAIPCRDIYCEYTPLVPTVLAVVDGDPVFSMGVVQLFIFGCALLTCRLARSLGQPRRDSRIAGLVTWLLILANEGRAIVLEPFTLLCLLAAANCFASGPSVRAAVASGLWIGVGFWTKQYALLGFVALVIAGLSIGAPWAILAMTAGVLLGTASGAALLMVLGTEPHRLWSLIEASAYPPAAIGENLRTAPDLLALAVLTLSTIARADLAARPGLIVPAAMSAAALLPLYFRGYRHYWQLALPFLVILVLRDELSKGGGRRRAAQRGAILLMVSSVALDVGRCVRDIVTSARPQQIAQARRLKGIGAGPAPVLYLVDPAVLAWIDAPVVALREVGPKFTRLTLVEAEARLAAAGSIVWDTANPGADESLRRFEGDRSAALSLRGFSLVRTEGAVRVYTRVPGWKPGPSDRE